MQDIISDAQKGETVYQRRGSEQVFIQSYTFNGFASTKDVVNDS
jgi:uncharacterized protein (AIM24 family)